MTGHGDVTTPPPLPEARSSRLPLVLEGNPEWTENDFSFDATRPGDSAVDIGWVDKKTGATKFMPLTPGQARRAGMELIIRADLVDPDGATR